MQMNKIKVMDSHLANMIAAGEVVERPSGIIKELIENALDAQATQVEVHIIEGGMGSIAVIDNGEGMSSQDLRDALKRHSTSKIFKASDLNQIQSYGFRGEALPSIASVSTLMIQTHDGTSGHEYVIDNGKEIRLSVFARNKGTTVIVENLFSKVPARLKYIKNTRYETSIIVDTIQKFAISRPDIAFRLVDNEKEVYRSFGDGLLKHVFYTVFGQAPSEHAFSIANQNYDFHIEGMFAQPQYSRSNPYQIWLYINDRMIRHPKITRAITEGFRRHIPKDRYPIGVLKVKVDPQLVDVNVHPSKWEIRLSKEEELINLIINTLEDKLDIKTKAPSIKILDEQTSFEENLFDTKHLYETPNFDIEERKQESIVTSVVTKEAPSNQEIPTFQEHEVQESLTANEIVATPKIEALDILAQMSGKYILAKGDKGLYIIDQHAAMERVRYEYYQDKLLDKQTPTQLLLIPRTYDGRQSLVYREEEVKAAFKSFCVDIEVLDQSSFVIREIPLWIKENEVDEFVNKTLDYLESQKMIREEDFRSHAIATLACHSSVRFNEYMSQIEMETLVQQLRSTRQPFHCPHGRPTFMILEESDILKGFLR